MEILILDVADTLISDIDETPTLDVDGCSSERKEDWATDD